MFLRKNIFWLPSLAALAVASTGLSAHAQTVDTQQFAESSTTVLSDNQSNAGQEAQKQEVSSVNQAPVSDTTALQQFPSINTQDIAGRTITPIPGTIATSSATLAAPESVVEITAQPSTSTTVAQSNISVARPTRGGSSYVGVAGNIGLSGGDSSISDGNVAVISKIGLTNAISVRPSAIFGNDTTILIPVTYDFTLKAADAFSEPLAIAPYVGIGAAIKTGDDSKIGFLASGGIDVPLNAQFTATAAVNAGFFDETDLGLLVGVGYNFSGF